MNQEMGRFRTALRSFLKPLAYSFLWTLLVTLIGLTQLWIMIGLSYLVKPLNYDSSQILRDGVLLFFVMAIVATIVIDYFFSGFPRLPLGLEAMIFCLFPFISGIFVTGSYVAMYVVDSQFINYDVATLMQKGAMVASLVYSLVAKFVHFHNQIRSRRWKP